MHIFRSNLLFIAKLGVAGCVLLLVWYFTTKSSPSTTQVSKSTTSSPQAARQATKKILMWNKFFHYKHFGYDISRPLFEDFHCEVTNCQIWDAQDGMPDIPVEDFDLLLFHGIPADTLWPTRPRVRKPNQIYLFYLLESPISYSESDYRHLPGFFNWTATFRADSDIFTPYGWFTNKTHSPDITDSKLNTVPRFIHPRFDNITTQVAAKTKLIYWRVSNCMARSDRDVYAEELSLHVPVDIFGKCGTPCTGNACDHDVLVKSYKFYLAFENSICKDYITEKFFNMSQYDVVPVVYGGGDYARFAPPYSYIDTRDFESPRQLADYLHFLDGNDAEYRQFFWWKDYYVLGGPQSSMLCTMCAMLNDPPPPKVVEDLQGWWVAGSKCVTKPAGILRRWKRMFKQDPVSICVKVVCWCVCVGVLVLLKKHCMVLIRSGLRSLSHVPVKS